MATITAMSRPLPEPLLVWVVDSCTIRLATLGVLVMAMPRKLLAVDALERGALKVSVAPSAAVAVSKATVTMMRTLADTSWMLTAEGGTERLDAKSVASELTTSSV